jgi:penicillin-binding protein 1A
MSLRRGTLQSDNSVYIQLAMDLGPDEVKRTARDMGITSTLKGYPAETLGGLENGVSPLEMATAYASISNGGFRVRPTAIKKIVFPDGRVEKGKDLPKRFRVKRVRIFEDGVAAKGREILEQNMTGGTGGHAIIPGCAAAGKTGTTDFNTDAWFVGFTPKLTTAVWVGYPKDDIQMNTLYFGGPVDGGTYPADVWGDYMGRISGGDCGQWKEPKTPFIASPFHGRYSSSGGSLTGGPEEDSTYDPTIPAPTVPAPEEEQPEPDSGGEEAPEGGDEGFDPTQYESAPQGPPETEPPPDAGIDGGAVAPDG